MAGRNPFDDRDAGARIAIVGGTGGLREMLASALDALGCRIVEAASADIVLLDGASDDFDLDAALERGARVVVAVAPGDIDAWGFAIGLAGVELVPDRDPEGLVRAIARAPKRSAAFSESAGDDPVQRLRELGSEVSRIAQALAALGQGGAVADRRPPYRGEPGEGAPVTAASVRAMIRARRVRDRFFAGELFADPAWDILLDLMAARLEGRDVAVSSLCIAAAVPPTTALRWISAMTEQGLLIRIADPDDRRRVFIRLSADTAERMAACLAALAAGGAVA